MMRQSQADSRSDAAPPGPRRPACRRTGLGILALAAALGVGGTARAACPEGPPVVTIDLPPASVSVVQVDDVGAYAPFSAGAFAGAQRPDAGARWVVNGLTQSTHGVSAEIAAHSRGGCVTVDRVALTFAVGDPVRVLVSGKYPPGSCQYTTIERHEMQHVDILRRGRSIYAERFRLFAEAAARGPFDDLEVAKARIGQAVDGVSAEFDRAMAAANASIDTPEAYLSTQALCPTW